MKNLKRALSLALASVMLLGMMVVGAGAANFGDADKIQNTDAVNTLVALDILKGKDDGNFDPEGLVTRAEMAKMICVALNGGKDPNLTDGGMYPDTKNHWARGYIDYCTNLKIVSGDTAGNFNPDKTVTGTEAAKMILIAIGFSAENEKFVNDANWATNINVRASQKDLYEDVPVLPSAGLTRDNAAQMIWNGLQANMVRYQYELGTENGNLSSIAIAEDDGVKTILNQKFKMETEYGYLTGWTYDDKKAEYNYSFTTAAGVYGPAITTDPIGITLKTTKDFTNLFGMKVKTLYKQDSNNTVYGFYADGAVLAEGVWGDVTDKADTLKYDGTTYDKNDNYGAVDYKSAAAATLNNEFTFKAIDNNDDGKVDVTVVTPFTVAKVTFVGKDSITAGGVAYEFEDCDIYENVAKDDIAIITAKANTAKNIVTIAAAEKLSGDITAVNADGEKRVDGTWYDKADSAAPSGGNAFNTLVAGDSVDFYMVNGYVVYAKVTEGTATLDNVLYVVDADITGGTHVEITKSMGGTYKGVDHLVLKADGTKETVKAMRVDGTSVSADTDIADSDVRRTTAAPGLYTYKVNKDGVYELKAVKAPTAGTSTIITGIYESMAANLPGSTSFGSVTGKSEADETAANNAYSKTDKKLHGAFIADDATIYINDTTNGKQKVVSGKDLKTMASFGASASYLYKAVSGLNTVQVACITTSDEIPGTNASAGYGYVTSAGYAEKNADDEWIVKFTVWNGTEDVELTATDEDNTTVGNAEFAKGAFVKYTNTAVSGEVTDTEVIGIQAAITGWDGSKNIAFDGSLTAVPFKDDDKTVVIYVNTADKKGVAGGEIVLAQELNDPATAWVSNAVYKMDGSEVEVLFVDTANKLAGANYTVTTVADETDTLQGITLTATTTVDGNALSDTDPVASGKTITVTVTPTGDENNTGAYARKATVTLTRVDGVTEVKTLSFSAVQQGSAGSAKSVTFTMPDMNVTSIVVTYGA